MSYGQLFCRSGNIGDDFQGLAAGLHLPAPPEHFVDRDNIHRWVGSGRATLIMNGWFSGNVSAWPPAPNIDPVFVGFHVAETMKPAIGRHVEYLRRFEPIGTRDHGTTEFVRSIGVMAETTYCLTLTFPARDKAPKSGKVYIVDAETISIPSTLRSGAVKLTHMMPALDYRVTLPCARELLALYRDTARLVITTRLHAALPCMAMGIPVIFFADPGDTRSSIVRDIGGAVYNKLLHQKSMARGLLGSLYAPVNWSPDPIDISTTKARLNQAIVQRLNRLSSQIR